MPKTLMQNKTDLSLNEALTRMRKYAVKSKSSFSASLNVTSPDTSGRLAGPANQRIRRAKIN